MRPARLERVEGDAHHASRLGALEVELVELGPEDVAILAGRREAAAIGRPVVGLERVRQADETALRYVDRERLIVVEQVAHVAHPVLGEQTHRPLGVGEGRREPPGEALARVAEHCRDHVLDDRSLLRLVHPEEVARVVDPVGEELPSCRAARLDDLGMMLAERDVQRDAAPDAVRAQDVQYPPDADAVAVVAIRVGRDVGLSPGPRAPGRIVRGEELVELDVRRHPDGDARVTGPGKPRPIDDRRVLVELGIGGRHGWSLPASGYQRRVRPKPLPPRRPPDLDL